MLLTVRDEVSRYLIECPDGCGLKLDYRGGDFLIVDDPGSPGTPFWLFDEILIEAARAGEFGLRLLSEVSVGEGAVHPPTHPAGLPLIRT